MTYPDFDRLAPERSICFLPFDGQFRQDVGENLLTNGNFEAGIAGWDTALASGWAIRNDSPPEGAQWAEIIGGSGTQIRQVGVGVINAQYHATGFSRRVSGSTGTYIGFGTNLILHSTSTAWQPYDLINTFAGNQNFALYHSGTGSSGFDAAVLLEHPQVCRSLSQQVGALNYARLGDGHTASTMPGQRSGGRGLDFAGGGKYINLDWVQGGALDTQTFTFVMYGRPKDVNLNDRLFSMGNAATYYQVYMDTPNGVLKASVTGGPTLSTPLGLEDGQDHTYALVLSSTEMTLYVDGVAAATVAGDVRLASLPSDTQAMIGTLFSIPTASTAAWHGLMYSSAIYPFALNQSQVREVGRRMRQLRNI